MICYIAKQNKSKFWRTLWDSTDIRPPSTARTSSNIKQLMTVWRHGFLQSCPVMAFGGKKVSLLGVMWSWTKQWTSALLRKKCQLYNSHKYYHCMKDLYFQKTRWVISEDSEVFTYAETNSYYHALTKLIVEQRHTKLDFLYVKS